MDGVEVGVALHTFSEWMTLANRDTPGGGGGGEGLGVLFRAGLIVTTPCTKRMVVSASDCVWWGLCVGVWVVCGCVGVWVVCGCVGCVWVCGLCVCVCVCVCACACGISRCSVPRKLPVIGEL